jgi:hypothetical protein
MFNSYTIKIYTFSQKLIDDKIFAKATTPEAYAKIETKSKCPMSKFAKYMPFLTLKHCSGISSFYNRSLLMKSWADYYACTLNGKSFSLSADKKYTVRDHPKEQFSPMFGDKIALKLMSPFIIEAPKNLMFLVSEAVYHYDENREYKNIKCLQGVVAETNQSNIIFLISFIPIILLSSFNGSTNLFKLFKFKL